MEALPKTSRKPQRLNTAKEICFSKVVSTLPQNFSAGQQISEKALMPPARLTIKMTIVIK